ncbi:hypothetical protein N0Y54_06805 [Nostoc punctiforme UO1]|uniref:hypothetical protein n=1 Tax=Nostoc punctiforme TaxID=272131 RepID=UPI0030ADF37A
MSVVTLEQQTLVVLTELADEEISEIVGGTYKSPDFKSRTSVKVKVKGDNVITLVQVGNALATDGGKAVVEQNSYNEINNSKNNVKTWGGY